jgi:hypothetical protein
VDAQPGSQPWRRPDSHQLSAERAHRQARGVDMVAGPKKDLQGREAVLRGQRINPKRGCSKGCTAVLRTGSKLSKITLWTNEYLCS